MTPRQRGWLLPPAAAMLIAGVLLGRITEGLLLPLCACALSVFAVLLLKGRLRFLACLIFSLALGAFAGCLAFHPVLPAEGEYLIHGVVSDEIGSGSFGQVRVCLSDVTLDGRSLNGGAYWTFYTDEVSPELLPGKAVSFRASLYHPRGEANPGGYNFRETLLQKGITVGLYGKDELEISEADFFSFAGTAASVRHSVSCALRRELGEETGTYASALLLGMRSLIPSEDRLAFSNLGIAHILSVSGFHVGLLIGALASLFSLLHLRQEWRFVLYAVLLFLYAALCGMNQPVIRASMLMLLSVEGRILHRPRSGIHLLSGALLTMALLSPVQVTSASFQLSFGAAFGIIWFAPLIRRLQNDRPVRRRILESLIFTFGAQLGILFPELFFFQRLPLLVFLMNLPAILVFSVLIWFFWIALLLLPIPGLSALLSVPLSAVTSFLLSGVRTLGTLSGLTLWIHMPTALTLSGVVLVFLAFCQVSRFRLGLRAALGTAGTVLIVISLLPAPHASTEYIQFSAGNADAAILRDREKTYVIDTGENDGTLSTYLRQNRLTPDAVILTHLHTDHAGGLQSMIDDGIPVPLLYLPEGAERQLIHPDFLMLLENLRESGTEIRVLSRGDVIPLPSGTLAVLWPESGKVRPRQDANNYSLVSRLTLKGTVLLLGSDLTGIYEHYCAVPADILKASHHGSLSSTSQAFLSAVDPNVILLSCRFETRLASFRERTGNIPVYGTPESGALTVRFEEGSYTIIPYRSH